MWFYYREMGPNDADRIMRMANSVEWPDCSFSSSDLGLHCLTKTCLSENLISVRYFSQHARARASETTSTHQENPAPVQT